MNQDLIVQEMINKSPNSHLDNLITVIISTKNRLKDLERALLSLRSQNLLHKVIVIDDNSDDGTSEYVRSAFPEVFLHSHNESKGYIVRRNEGVALAKTPYVLSIDDDCVLESPEILFQLASFCSTTKSAAVAWPHVDVRASNVASNLAPFNELWQACTFKGCSFIVSKSHFIELGGFRANFIHQGEEEDFCIRLLDKGFPVLLGFGHPIHHYESPVRSWKRMDYFGSRNLILFAFFNVPLVFLPVQLLVSAVKSIAFGFKIRRPYQKSLGVLHGFRDGFRLMRNERKPVSIKTFLTYRKLKKKESVFKNIRKINC